MHKDYLLHVDSCLTPYERIHHASILLRLGSIVAVGGYSALKVLDNIPCIHMPDCHAIPGLVDTHLHGTGGFDAMDADRGGDMTVMSRTLARHGVTSYVPTVLSAAPSKMAAVIERLAGYCNRLMDGAVPVGIHIEGPFLSREKRGAQSIDSLRPIDLGLAQELLIAGKGAVKSMTFAPELEHSTELIELLRSHNVIPSMGHSMATGNDALRAIEAGATRCTHLFNGMPLLDQREAGLTSVALTNDHIIVELTVDGIHVHPRMIEIACRSKPLPQIVGISDATQGAGLADGIYHLGDDEITIAHGECRRSSDGRLAGSCLTLDSALRHMREFTTMSEHDVVACYTANAARSIGLTDRGVIQPGKRGDVVVVDDHWEIQLTIVNGRIVYDRRGVSGKGQIG